MRLSAAVLITKVGNRSDWTLDSPPGVAAQIPLSTILFRNVVLDFQSILEVAELVEVFSVVAAWVLGWEFWICFQL